MSEDIETEKGISKTIHIDFIDGRGDGMGSPEDVLRMVADLAESGFTSGHDMNLYWTITEDVV